MFLPSNLCVVQKLEARTATDEDLKLTDLLRYYERDTKAALGMMYRRIRSLANLQNTTKALDKAKQKGKGVDEVCHMLDIGVLKCTDTFRQRATIKRPKRNLSNILKLENKVCEYT